MLIALVILVLVGGLIGALGIAVGHGVDRRVTGSPLIGHLPPAVRGPGVDGGQVDVSVMRGQWVVVNFFATWCVPCQQEHPDLVAFDERHRSIGDAALIGVIYADAVDVVRAYRRDHGGRWPMIADPDGTVAVSFGVTGVPETYVINPDGMVVAKLVGRVTEAGLDALIQRATARAR